MKSPPAKKMTVLIQENIQNLAEAWYTLLRKSDKLTLANNSYKKPQFWSFLQCVIEIFYQYLG